VKGIYILLIQLTRDVDVKIGALGTRHFPKGTYAYVGSAQTNLEKRVSRHFRREKQKFWHIDYLLDNPAAKPTRVFFKAAPKTQECTTATEISQQNEPIQSFGCSDCNCKSHLFRIENPDFRPADMTELDAHELSS
jgi:Uri superfamily endonuclease